MELFDRRKFENMIKILFWQRNERGVIQKFQIFIKLKDAFHVMQTIKLWTPKSGLSVIKIIISKFWTTKILYMIEELYIEDIFYI